MPPLRPSAGWRRDVLRRRMLGAADVLSVVSCVVAFRLASPRSASAAALLLAVVVAAMVAAKALGLYDRDHRSLRIAGSEELPNLFAWAVGTGVVVSLLSVHREQSLGGRDLGIFIGTLFIADVVVRGLARAAWRKLTPAERVAVIGFGAAGATLRRKFDLLGGLHAEIVVVLEEDAMIGATDAGRVLDELSISHPVDRVVVAAATLDERLISDLVAACRLRRMKLGIVPPVRAMFGTAVRLDHLAELPIVQYNTWDVSRTTRMGKRAIDVAAASLGLLVVAPLLAVIALIVRIESPGPALFRQQRSGRDGEPFTMLKFRSMVDGADRRLEEVVDIATLGSPVFKVAGDPRVTRFGAFLRRRSLDELPQLWNIMRGDMSLVGPRPEQVELVHTYSDEVKAVRLAVRPGMTGPMQVSGRGDLTFDERVAIEREYVENLSLRRDLLILAATVSAVVSARGAY